MGDTKYEWDYQPVDPERPYIIKKDYGDVVLVHPVYVDKKGNIYIDSMAIAELPEDVTEEEMDNTWVKGFPPGRQP